MDTFDWDRIIGSELPVAILVGVVLSVIIGKKRYQHSKPQTRMAPVLLGNLVHGDMFNGLYGETPKGNYFTYIVTGMSLFSGEQTKGMYAVELPYKSGAHLVGLPKLSHRSIGDLKNVGGIMEPVVLEGDYPKYFNLYSDKDMQSHSRYVMDPSAMVFTVDFCREYEWEILDDTLYFVSKGIMPGFDVVDTFINEIRPAVEVPSDRRKNPHEMPYIGTTIRSMKCPVCDKRLVAKKMWMACADGHGFLITGSQLSEVRNQEKGAMLSSGDISRLRPLAPRELTCPYCFNPMQATQYSFTPVMIDICSKCMYRWVDSDEASVVFGRDPELT